MKKLLAVVLVLAMALSLTACDLFSDDSVVQFEEAYTHHDPDGLKYDERKVLINKNFGTELENNINSMAYPDTLKYDDDGGVVGMYDYDPATGIASGWTDLTTGEFHEEEQDLGMPDEALMVSFSGTVTLGSVIYGNEDKAVYAYLYVFLSDAADQDAVQENMELYYAIPMTEESDTVLVFEQDAAAISAKFQEWQELYGQTQSDRSATGYASNLQLDFGLKNYGVNPYAPYGDIVDPTDVDFDERVLLTSNGAYSFVDESLEKALLVRTDVIYGYQGKAVAHYIYYEYSDKASADELIEQKDGNFFGEATRISDTVVQDQLVGQNFQDIVNSYIGYSVLQDDSLEGYVTNVEETYFAMRYDQ